MTKIIIGTIVLVIALFSFLAFSGPSHTQTVSRSQNGTQFIETYKKTPNAVLIDVRTPSEFASGHLENSINLDFDNQNFSLEMQKFDATKTYFVYCRSGNRSGQAIILMKKNGIQDIYELQGGLVSNQSTLSLVTGI